MINQNQKQYKLINKYPHFSGELKLQNSLDMNYGIFNNRHMTFDSLSEIFTEILNSSSPFVKFAMRLDNNHKIEKQGKLHINKDKYDIDSLFINEYPLESELFDLVGSEINGIWIEHLAEAENMEAVGNSHEQASVK